MALTVETAHAHQAIWPYGHNQKADGSGFAPSRSQFGRLLT